MSLVESTVDSLEISEDWPDLAVLERFETAWRAGDRLSIEATLAEVEPSRVPGLLMLLVSEEFQLRVEDGESPSPFAYLDRFPEYPGAIRAAFEGRAAATPWAGRSIARDRRASPGPTDPGSTDPVAAQPGHDQNGKDQGHLPKDGCRYQIREHHASGGLGDLYLADDQELPRKVVLKEIQPRHLGDPKARERFLIEARVTSQLEHPGIVPVHGLGHYRDGRPYYAMRFIKGDSLRRAIERLHHGKDDRSPSEHELMFRGLLGRFVDVCDAIEYAHSRGVLHRDIKPGNIMLGEYGETLVVDWGLAKILGPDPADDPEATEDRVQVDLGDDFESTLANERLGTLRYMSPEQSAGDRDRLGPATDIFSLGATLSCLVTGQAPYPDFDREGVKGSTIPAKLARPRTGRRDVPAALESICLKAMARDPADRYPSARAMADDVDRWLADEPVLVHAYPVAARAGRWLRRHRPWAVAASVLLVLLSVALVISNVWIRASEREAEENFRIAIKAVDEMLVKVSEWKVIFVPGSNELRAKLIEDAARFYEELIRRRPADREIRRKAALINRQEANNLRLIGEFARSLSYSGRAIQTDEFLASSSAEPDDLVDLALARYDHGEGLWFLGRTAEAAEVYRRVIREVEPAIRDHPEAANLALPLARAHFGVAETQLEAGEFAAARTSYDESIRGFDASAKVKDMAYLARLLRLQALAGRGIVAHLEGRAADADAAFQEARDSAETLDPRPGKNPDIHYFRSLALEAQGEHLAVDPARRGEARDAFEQAVSFGRRVSTAFPSTVEFKLAHATAMIGRAGVALDADPADRLAVAEDLKAARAILDALLASDPDLPRARGQFARLLTLQGRLALARGEPAEPLFQAADEERGRALEAQPGNPAYQPQRRPRR